MGKYDGLKKVIKKHVKGFGKTVENIIWRLAEEQAEEIAKYLERCQKSIAEGEDECEFCIKNEIGFVDDELGVVLTNAVINHENEMLQDPSANILIMEGLETLIIKAKRFDEDCDVEEYFYNTLKRVSYVDDLMLTIKLSLNAIKHMDAIVRAGKRMKDESGFDLFLIYMSDDIVVVELERRNADSEECVEEEEYAKSEKDEIEDSKPVKSARSEAPVQNTDMEFRETKFLKVVTENFESLINGHDLTNSEIHNDVKLSYISDMGEPTQDESERDLIGILTPYMIEALKEVYNVLKGRYTILIRCYDKRYISADIVTPSLVDSIWDNNDGDSVLDKMKECDIWIKIPKNKDNNGLEPSIFSVLYNDYLLKSPSHTFNITPTMLINNNSVAHFHINKVKKEEQDVKVEFPEPIKYKKKNLLFAIYPFQIQTQQ